MARRGASARRAARPVGVRVVVDARPLQEPQRGPITAYYLERLLEAFATHPLAGESFVLLLRALSHDPTRSMEEAGLAVSGRRLLPPTSRVFRSAGLTLDSFLLRGAGLGAGSGALASGAAGTVYHSAGGGMPLASVLPMVASVLDLAPWELPERYAATGAARLGHRLRARALRKSATVIVASDATARTVRRLLHVPEERISVVPLAADPLFRHATEDGSATTRMAALGSRFDLPSRYLVFVGRYDARKDFATLFEALAALREQAPKSAEEGVAWPPVVVLAGASGDDNADSPAVARAARRFGVEDVVRLTPRLDSADLAALQSGAVAHVQPALSDGTGIAAIDALAAGIPVICTRVGALPEVVGAAGIIVEPREPGRLASAIRAMWEAGAVARQISRRARLRAEGAQRTWDDVAHETRLAYVSALEPHAQELER